MGYLFIVVVAVIATCLAIQAATIRLAYGMARDRQLPGSQLYARVSDRTHTPVGACLLVGALTAIPFIEYSGLAIIVIGATGMTYLAYLLGNIALLRARRGGWPAQKGAFSLGRWGMPLNLLALGWGASMLVNFFWHRPETNPKPEETEGALDLGWGVLNDIPIQWSTLGAVLLVGLVYYALRHRQLPSPLAASAPSPPASR